MKWATQKDLGLNRPPCFWLIRKFIDPAAEFFLFPVEVLLAEAAKIGAKTFHAEGADYLIGNGKTTMEKIMDAHGLGGKDPALDLLAEIFNDMVFRVKTNTARHVEAYGLRALDTGFRASAPDDLERMQRTSEMYEALYQWCRQRVGVAVSTH